MIHREMFSEEHGDVIFPIAREVSDPWERDYCTNCLYNKKYTRNEYFEEIRNILNGYQKKWELWKWEPEFKDIPGFDESDDYREIYVKAFNRIKNGESPDAKFSRFYWLNTNEVKQAIRNWNGDPLDILYYLAHSGIIEKAVHRDYKSSVSK
jgi:hypothetical protein